VFGRWRGYRDVKGAQVTKNSVTSMAGKNLLGNKRELTVRWSNLEVRQ
jgi:hypothetical protein